MLFRNCFGLSIYPDSLSISQGHVQREKWFFRFVLLCLLLCSVSAFGQSTSEHVGFKLLNKREVARFPFRQINNLIVIPVILENKLPLHFILDTGVRTTILTDRVYSDLLDINYIREYTIRGAGSSQSIEAYVASEVSLSMPGVDGKNLSLFVLKEDYLKLSSQLGVQVDGILGYEFFSHFVVKIDYQQEIISIYLPGTYKPGRVYKKMALELEKTKPYILCQVEEKEGSGKKSLRLMLDTGASHSLLLHQDSDSMRFELPEKTLFGSLGRGLGGEVMGYVGRIHQLRIKDFYFDHVLASFPVDSSYGNVSEWNSRGGTIGGNILNRFVVVFDYPGEAVYFKKGKGFRSPFVFNKTGLQIAAEGKELNSFMVQEVRKASPAYKAGIKEGDEIIRINGISANSLTLSKVLGILGQRDGKQIKLQLKRGENEIKVRFRLKDII